MNENSNLLNLLEKLGRTSELALIKNHYRKFFNDDNDISYSYRYRKKANLNELIHATLEQLDTPKYDDFRKALNTIFSKPKEIIDAEEFIVSKENLTLIKETLAQTLKNVILDRKEEIVEFFLFATIGLKIYCSVIANDFFDINTFVTKKNDILNRDTAIRDFNSLKIAKGNKEYDTLGKITCNYYNFAIRAQASLRELVPLATLLNQLQIVGRMMHCLKKHNCLNYEFKRELVEDYVPNEFNPFVVKRIVQWLKTNSRAAAYMFNPTGGWGGRLIGALASDEITRYIETDPNPYLIQAKKKITEELSIIKNDGIFIYHKPVEDLTYQEFCPNSKKNDFSLYSPPYFDIEKYQDNGDKTQSYLKYKTLDQWISNFLVKLLLINYQALKLKGVMAINIASFVVAPKSLGQNEQWYNKMYPGILIKRGGQSLYDVNVSELLHQILCKDTGHGMKWKKLEQQPYIKIHRQTDKNLIFIYESLDVSEVPGLFPESHQIIEEEISEEIDLQIEHSSSSHSKHFCDTTNFDVLLELCSNEYLEIVDNQIPIQEESSNEDILTERSSSNTDKQSNIDAIQNYFRTFYENKHQDSRINTAGGFLSHNMRHSSVFHQSRKRKITNDVSICSTFFSQKHMTMQPNEDFQSCKAQIQF